jgi:hypothetical protein
MNNLSPQETYHELCSRLRHRIEFAETILGSSASTWQIAETVALQGRKSIETIAHMSLVATEHSLGKLGIPRDVKKHWNAEVIFERLNKRNIHILPSPSRMMKSDNPRFKAIFSGVSEYRLTYKELIELYRMCHGGLHDINPYAVANHQVFLDEIIPKLSEAIGRLKKFVWVHFIGIKGEGFAVDLKNHNGATVVIPLSKIAEISERC